MIDGDADGCFVGNVDGLRDGMLDGKFVGENDG